MAAVIRGVRVGPSPAWLAERLRAVGQRPINNVVDATNYILFELNQPLHAFDLGKLRGPAVVIRRARSGERIVTLDGVPRTLTADMTAICDAERPTIVAGVMASAPTSSPPASAARGARSGSRANRATVSSAASTCSACPTRYAGRSS
jgi:phenylalanyl-tRNA synthetase beta chain